MARFLLWPDVKSDRKMSTGTTDHNQKRPAPDWYPRAVALAAMGAFALCIGFLVLIRTQDSPAVPTAPPHQSASAANMAPVVPWTPGSTVNPVGKNVPLREGPFTLMPDAPKLQSAGAFVTLLGNGLASERFYISDHENKGSFLGGAWVKENVTEGADGVRLDVTGTDIRNKYKLGELQLSNRYGYGRYEVIMRPAKGSGLVSAFFTYTGQYFGDPHDEIDIEFVGMSTSIIQLNYFRDGKKGKFANIKLPFDASEADHLYAFDWKPEGISWYVDGKLIYRTADGDRRIPRTPGRIYISNWTGIPQMRQWHGRPDFGDRGSAYYSCISFTPLGENTRRCADIYKPGTRFPEPVE